MPCNSDYLQATSFEVEMSRVALLLDELRSGRHVDPRSGGWRGYDRRIYNRLRKRECDAMVAELCRLFLSCPDMSKLSLEAQTWWRDHRIADGERLAREKQG